MTKLDQVVDLALFNSMVTKGYINLRESNSNPDLIIANYSSQAQIDSVWNEATIACRGLIYNRTNWQIIARPFAKFFNLENHPPGIVEGWLKEAGSYDVFEKHDGSLGIGYIDPKEPYRVRISTRGSMDSEMAEWASEWIEGCDSTGWSFALEEWAYDCIKEGATPIFEIVYKDNRIVRNYGGFEGLIPLGSISIATGKDTIHYRRIVDILNSKEGRYAKKVLGNITIGSIESTTDDFETTTNRLLANVSPEDLEAGNVEGWVYTFKLSDGTTRRTKVKTEPYRNLHYLVTSWTMGSQDLSYRTLKAMRAGVDLSELDGMIPEDLYLDIRECEETILNIVAQRDMEVYHDVSRLVLQIQKEQRDPTLISSVIANNRDHRKRFVELAKSLDNPDGIGPFMRVLNGGQWDWLKSLSDEKFFQS